MPKFVENLTTPVMRLFSKVATQMRKADEYKDEYMPSPNGEGGYWASIQFIKGLARHLGWKIRYIRTCQYEKCGTEFVSDRPDAKFCCDTHRVEQHRLDERHEFQARKL